MLPMLLLLLLMLMMRASYSRVDNSNVFIPSPTTSLSLWFVSKMMSMVNVPVHLLPCLQPQSCNGHSSNTARSIPCRRCWKAQPYQHLHFGGGISLGGHYTRVKTRRRSCRVGRAAERPTFEAYSLNLDAPKTTTSSFAQATNNNSNRLKQHEIQTAGFKSLKNRYRAI